MEEGAERRMQRLNSPSPSSRDRDSVRTRPISPPSSGTSQQQRRPRQSLNETTPTTPPTSTKRKKLQLQEAIKNRFAHDPVSPQKLQRQGQEQTHRVWPERGFILDMPGKVEAASAASSSRHTSNPSSPVASSRSPGDDLEMRTPCPIDTASKKKKSRKNKHKSLKVGAPGFDLTTQPGDEKTTVVGFMQRLKHSQRGNNSPHQLGICYNTVEVKEGDANCHQSTLTITAEDANGAPYAWSGKEFRGEVVRKKVKAESAAAREFLADADVQQTAATMDPVYPRQLSENQKRKLSLWREIRHAKNAASAAGRQRRRHALSSVSNRRSLLRR
ncbi:unnamed protein product [Symbiodinium sp. CCMP2592]|nr:unnamed protein product [Symbiodinium sp. CCMP2592]